MGRNVFSPIEKPSVLPGRRFFLVRGENMKHDRLRKLIFWALCCDLGLFSKRLIGPAANILTDSLHIPGGVSTGFSLMFLVVAAVLIPQFGSAALMGIVQSAIALSMGMVGSMGALAPVGYIEPGLVIDCVVYLGRKLHWSDLSVAVTANMAASASASLTADLLVFRLRAIPLLLYLAVALTTGAICGILGDTLAARLRPVIKFETKRKKREENNIREMGI